MSSVDVEKIPGDLCQGPGGKQPLQDEDSWGNALPGTRSPEIVFSGHTPRNKLSQGNIRLVTNSFM